MIIGPPPKFHGTRDILQPLPTTESVTMTRRDDESADGDSGSDDAQAVLEGS
jgi:hypothetical protein